MKSSKVKDSLTICNKLKKKNTLSDTKMKPIRLPPLTSTSKKSQELLEVQALPSDWVPDTRPSKVVQNLLQKRKEEHEGVVEKMRNSMGDVNDQVENDIGVAAVIYKQTLQESKKDVDGCLQSIRQMLKGPSNLAITNFSAAIDDIVSIYRSNKHNLFNLLQKLKGLEKFRCEAFQRFLREAYIKLNQISYSTPFEIQLFFEQEIQAINEMTLSNIRGYTELKAHLKLQLQNEIRLLLCEIQYLRENWFYYIKYTLFTTLNRDKLFGKDCNQEALGINTAVTEEDECSTCTDWGNESTINVNKMYQWVNKIENVMNHMDTCAKKLVGSFKEAIIKIVASYFDDMRKAIQTILDLGIIENWEVKMVQAEFCGQAVVDVTGKYTEELANLQELWAGSKRELQTCLEDAFVFLKSFSDIWSMHFRRVNEIKSIVAKDLLRVIRDGFLLVCAEEMKINIKIDSLRQESNKKILEEGADSVAKYLDNLKDLYIQNQKKESAIVENIKDLAGLEAELLESELMYFLQRYYGKSSSINEKPSRRNSDVCSANDEIESHNSKAEPAKTLLAGEIRMCNRQIGLLQHWKSGLHTVIIKYVNKCKEESAILASVWINTEKSKSLLRLRLIEVVHAARFNRLTPLITDLRLAEIERMYARFEEHKADVEQEISNMALIFPRYEIKYTQILEECETVVGQIKNRAVNAKNSATVTSEISYLQNIITSGMEKIAKVSEAYQADASLRICQILKFNLLYVKALRLFSEGGNFSLNAAKDICNELSKIEKQYKKQITSLSHENDKKYSKCLQKLGNTKFQVTGFLCKYEDELKHCDNYIYALKDVQVELKKEVYQIKLKGKQLRASMKNLWEMGEKSVGEPQKLQRFVRHANKCIQIIEENEFALKRPLVRKGSSNVSMKQSVTRQSTSLSLAIGKLQSKIKNSMTYTDYSLFLFDTVPRKENSFIGKTRYLLYMSYKNLQKEAKDFYDSHAQATIINEEKIHRTYQEFVSDTLPKYVYYYLQCELIWLEEANAFLQTIDKILPNLRKLRIDSLRKYAEIYFKELKEAFHTIYAELNNIKSDSKNKFLSLYKKLMPLHGYPRNSKLLEDLNKQMEQFFQKQAEIYVNPVNKHKEHFNDKELQFTVGLFQINDSIVAVEASYEDKSYNRLISFELLETLLHLRKFVILPQDIYLEESVLQNVAKKIEFYKKNIIIPPEYLLNVSASSLLCNSPRDNSSFITIRLEDFMTKKLEVYTQQKEELIENIASIVEENKFNIGIWQDMWDKAVENVTGLYKVKYDQPAV